MPSMLKRFFYVRARILIVLCVLGQMLPLVSQWFGGLPPMLGWGLDLVVHWQWLFLVVCFLASLLAGLTDRRWLLGLLVIPIPWWVAGWDGAVRASGQTVLAVASANIHNENRDAGLLLEWVRAEQPDVIILYEISPDFAAQLTNLKDYPFRALVPQDDPFGIAVLSRLPLTTVRVARDVQQIPRIEADVTVAGRVVKLYAEHPMPPINAAAYVARDQKLAARATALCQSGQPGILAGDLNTTAWSSALRSLQKPGLARATALVPTWPALAGSLGRMLPGIPIDNILVTSDWIVTQRTRGPWIGSDHYPVLVRLAWRKS